MNQVAENPDKHCNSFPLVAVVALLVTSYVAANVMAVKLINVGGVTFFDAGTIIFPISYMLGDVLTEIWGFKMARNVIWLTFFCCGFFVLATAVGVWLPYPEYMADTADAYATVFTYVPRIIVASLAAFLVGELVNAKLMVVIKRKTGNRKLWMRTIGSSVVGVFCDSALFVVLAFAGASPVRDLLTMTLFLYVGKLLIEAVCATPLAYALVYYLRRKIQ